ncbi:type II and III secretion system protein family protein [Shewanella schlegeliana]|uniref:Type II and III secretion system protein family protein n=1 Tax=Shewanella schlegeliana TaxID=190308 RepID=A0ABS1SZ59_9GAMM|nr:type II and III secretion system protein family protein [Shewanella schlegeliana]MBL4913831.1 type II and III secretion system protein family protein [Shewanella schlegeliana]MCL1108785.1 type II and III secretion system protein family protein [Shewanella schlegeliana]GIU26037.1 pilus assembly protein CpaC [Shewanella schlegeliana]
MSFLRYLSIVCLLALLELSTAYAGGPTAGARADVQRIPIFKSRVLMLNGPVHRVSVGNPSIADIKLLPNDELYILGKQLGSTNVMIWDKNEQLARVMDIEVTHDLNGLKTRLYQFLPTEKLGVQTSQGQLLLSGQASNLQKMNTAVELAQGYAEAAAGGRAPSKVLNMMTIGGDHQVMLEVVVAEVQRNVARQFDSKFFIFNQGSNLSGGVVGGGGGFDPGSIGGIDAKGIFAQYINGDLMMNFALDVAKQNGLAKVLAEPNVTAMSGQSAQFLSGGEFPIPVPGENGNTTIEYRDYGVGVKFVPTVLDSGQINLNLNVVVSEISTANSFAISGNTSTTLVVPSLVKRSTATTVELADGQTIAISGLISDTLRENIDKLPGLGDVPVLGQLFTSKSFQSGQSELVILVTPRLVRAFNRKDISLPTDGFVLPSDVEFYLLGKLSHKEKNDDTSETPYEPVESDAKLDDSGTQQKYGHSL